MVGKLVMEDIFKPANRGVSESNNCLIWWSLFDLFLTLCVFKLVDYVN